MSVSIWEETVEKQEVQGREQRLKKKEKGKSHVL